MYTNKGGKKVTRKFKSGELHERHVVATWKLATTCLSCSFVQCLQTTGQTSWKLVRTLHQRPCFFSMKSRKYYKKRVQTSGNVAILWGTLYFHDEKIWDCVKATTSFRYGKKITRRKLWLYFKRVTHAKFNLHKIRTGGGQLFFPQGTRPEESLPCQTISPEEEHRG